MLRITVSETVESAIKYFQECLTRGDYYLEGQEVAGNWGGKGAVMLGLEGLVTKDAFIKLLKNRRPDGSRLTPRDADKRRPGYDFTFDVPKSVSLLQACFNDEPIRVALDRAVQETMMEIERDMNTRVRRHGAFEDRKTGNMIWASFTHFTSRPAPAMNGLPEGLPDPQLHMHVYCANATYDSVEERFKAGEFMRIKRDAYYYQAAFHTRLAGELQKLGYDIRPTRNAFEIDGVPSRLLQLFSRRTKQIEDYAQKEGIFDAKRRSALGAKLRAAKEKDLTMTELRDAWEAVLTEQEREQLDSMIMEAFAYSENRILADPEMAWKSIEYALQHELERVSETSEKRLLGSALKHGIGRTDIATVVAAYEANSDIIHGTHSGEKRVSTLTVLEEEQELIGMVSEGRASTPALVAGPYQFKEPMLRSESKDVSEQRCAALHILKSPDWVTGVIGKAGSGKTTLLKEIRAGARDAGYDMTVVAPTAEASREVLRSEGFARAETIKRLLTDEAMQEGLRGQVLLIDEVGMVGTQDMLALLKVARDKSAAKVVLSGDPKQIRSVPRGDALRTMQRFGGLELAHLGKVKRQRDPELKKAVEHISEGRVLQGFDQLDRHGGIIEKPQEERMEDLAKSYAEAVGERKGGRNTTALVVAPTHYEGETVTRHIRQALRERGHLDNEEKRFIRLKPLPLTVAERADTTSYESGMVLRFGRRGHGFEKGECLTVLRGEDERLLARRADGRCQSLPLEHADRLELFRPEAVGLSKGDTIRLTAAVEIPRGPEQRPTVLARGSFYQVTGFAKDGGIELHTGKTLPRDCPHFTHGYAITADSAQAKTVDKLFASMGENALSATDLRRFYVAISRAREEVRVYTHCREELMEAVRRDNPRRSASELVKGRSRESFTRNSNRLRAHEQAINLSRKSQERGKDWNRGPERTIDE